MTPVRSIGAAVALHQEVQDADEHEEGPEDEGVAPVEHRRSPDYRST